MNFVIQELYESVLITEMNQKVVDYLNQHTDELPFDHIFGDKMRVACPVGTDVTAHSIIDDLKRIQHFDKIDLKKGEIVRKIKLDPKYGQGDYKEQKINMGKAISALKISEDKKKKYLNWFAKYKDNLESAFEKPEYIVVLSRAPIDVVRMSDHRNISSCHSQGGSYFHCAIQEAITGGAVAYVVREEEFNELSEEEFQEDEIFTDPDRGFSGDYELRPLARLRVRRLVDDDGTEVAIPDTKVYGYTSIPNFYRSLKEYLHSKQNITSGDFKGQFTSRGGSYYDDDVRSLLASYFDTDEDTYYSTDFPKVKHDWDDESSERSHAALGMEEELNDIKERYNSRWDYSSVDYYMYDEDAFFTASGYTKIDISKFNLPDDVDLNIEDSYDIRKAKKGEYDDDYYYSTLVEYLTNKTDLNIYRIEIANKEIEITFDNQDTYNNPDQFDTFCYDLERFDNSIDDMLEDEDELLEVFLDGGFIKTVSGGDKNFSMIEEYMESEEEWFDNLSIQGGDIRKSFTVKISDFDIMEEEGDAIKSAISGKAQFLSVGLKEIIKNLAMENFKPKSNEDDPAQLQFQKFFESYTNPLEDIDYKLTVDVDFSYYDIVRLKYFRMVFPRMDNKNFQFVQFIDDMIPHILRAFQLNLLVMIKNMNLRPKEFEILSKKYNYPQLYKLYYKYL